MNKRSAPDAVELRIYVHAFVARFYFYMPVLVHHMQGELEVAGVARPEAVSVSLIGLLSVGMILAEYPSGLVSDWWGGARSLILAGVLQVLGVMLFLVHGSLGALVVAQIAIGVATAFRSGADTAMLHAHLERIGEPGRYGVGLSRLRFLNTLAIGLSGIAGGFMYAWSSVSVFWGAAISSVLGIVSLVGLDAGRVPRVRSYSQVVRDSIGEMRKNGAVRGLMLIGALGNPFFVLIYWITQRYLIDAEFSLGGIGVTVASISLLQASTMPLSAWISRERSRLATGLLVVIAVMPLAFAAASLAWAHARTIGALVLVGLAGCHVLFRNMVNVRIQDLVPQAVRASVVSFEAWLGALGYLVLFPLSGWLLATVNLEGTFIALAAILALCLWPLAALSHHRS